MRISTTTAGQVASSRADAALTSVPGTYRGEARALFARWVESAGTDAEADAAQAIVDTAYDLGQAQRVWSLVDGILAVLFVETPDAERWTTSGGVRFGAQGVIRTQTAPAQTTAPAAESATDEVTDAQLMEVLDRIATAAERIATALED